MDAEDPRDKELRELIEEALKLNVGERKKIKGQRDIADRVVAILQEYLDSFILLGYDMEGNALQLKSASSSQQHEALNSILIKYFSSEIGRM
jgi:hypothetical protein|tara:strand:- start:1982 stop:2257 length:276 start_codon:yes stop_codon:yes gene_type:complete